VGRYELHLLVAFHTVSYDVSSYVAIVLIRPALGENLCDYSVGHSDLAIKSSTLQFEAGS
jgi:hypothetical protein